MTVLSEADVTQIMERFKKHVNGLTAFSVVYWLAVTAQTVAIRRRLTYPGNFFVMAGVAFTLLVLAYDLTLRRRVTFRNIVFNRRRVSFVLALLISLVVTLKAGNFTWDGFLGLAGIREGTVLQVLLIGAFINIYDRLFGKKFAKLTE